MHDKPFLSIQLHSTIVYRLKRSVFIIFTRGLFFHLNTHTYTRVYFSIYPRRDTNKRGPRFAYTNAFIDADSRRTRDIIRFLWAIAIRIRLPVCIFYSAEKLLLSVYDPVIRSGRQRVAGDKRKTIRCLVCVNLTFYSRQNSRLLKHAVFIGFRRLLQLKYIFLL